MADVLAHDRRELIAYHEAAHAVVGHRQGLTFSAIYVGDAGGQVLFDRQWSPEEVVRDPALLDRYGLMLLAAAFAEQRHAGRVVGVEEDIEILERMLDAARIRGTAPRLDLWRRTEAQVAEQWPAIAALAEELVHRAGPPADVGEVLAAYPHLGSVVRETTGARARTIVGPLMTESA
jgi:hypothetical protein